MKCNNNDDREASAICSICHKPFCDSCAVELNGKQFCRACLADKAGDKLNAGGASKKSVFWAFVLSLLPGVGYLYLGLMRRGLQTLVLFYGSIFISAVVNFGAICAFILPVIVFYTVFDTLQLAKQINEGQDVEDKLLFETGTIDSRRNLVGIGLIILGVLALLHNLLPQYLAYHYFMNRFLPPLLIAALGIYILYKNAGRRE